MPSESTRLRAEKAVLPHVAHPPQDLSPVTPVTMKIGRRALDAVAGLVPPPEATKVTSMELGRCPAERITSDNPSVGAHPDLHVLHVHGGGYVVGSPTSHRALAGRMADQTGGSIYNFDYRLAPEYPYPAALDDAVAAYLDLVDSGIPPENLAISGDSAGGGLALAAARVLIDEYELMPPAISLISPWVQLADTHPKADTLLTPAGVHKAGQAYIGGADQQDPGHSPLLGDLSGLPRTLIQVGKEELLRGQAQRLTEKLENSGVDVRLSENNLWHVGQAGFSREGLAAMREQGAFLRDSGLEPVPGGPGRTLFASLPPSVEKLLRRRGGQVA